MVCIQILVKRKISRERRVRNGLSTSNTAHHLQVDLLHTLSSVLGFQPRARVLGGDSAVVDQRNLLTKEIPNFYAAPRRRFVEEQYRGVVHGGGGKHDPPLHPARERIDAVLA